MTITEHPLVKSHLSAVARETAGHSTPRMTTATLRGEEPPAPQENRGRPITTPALPTAAGLHLLRSAGRAV
ncbi:hypothetical protein [Streptomyces natalensis]|uniref:Uncharacterized protein n=1 Tax=Streptomyces natalensis ATCC 27448 TaxID=1240678 RepID=A0A0D7CLM8_9ACTN|nr:hypothetical protein [Streptomyces natalensis]KIZ16996.1 hypothetical protein SNA_18755 [Streptomyces natalensis ATCC 27448]